MDDNSLITENSKKILAARKAIIAEKKLDFVTQKNNSILVFKVDKIQKYALPYEQIERVIPYQTVTYVPYGNPIFLGMFYYNTEIWPVINCNRLFKFKEEELPSFFILCKKGTQRVALSVYEIIGQETIKECDQLIHFANEKLAEATYIRGIYQTDIAIIDLEAIFNILIQ